MSHWQKRTMSGREFKQIYKSFNISQAAIARYLGISDSTARRYVLGTVRVDPAHAMLLRALIEMGERPVNVPPYKGRRREQADARSDRL